MDKQSDKPKRKDVLKMAVLAKPVKVAFSIKAEKSEAFKEAINSTNISEIQDKVKKIKNITMKDSRNEKI